MSDSGFVFEWRLNDIGNRIVERLPISNCEAYLSENGTIAEEIFATCAVKTVERKSNFLSFETSQLFDGFSSDFFGELQKYLNDFSNQKNLSKESRIIINFDLLEKIAFAYVRDVCQKHPQGIEMTNKSNKIMELLNDIIVMALTPDNEKSKREFVDLPNSKAKDDGLQKFRELFGEIERSNIEKAYIKTKKKRKCVALYKKWAGQELTIAFSGHHDCICTMLETFFGLKYNRYDDYLKIADAIGANLAGTSCQVSRYKFVEKKRGDIVRYDRIRRFVGVKKEEKKDYYYSCCERKIFAFLDNRDSFVYGGKLFVKYPPCQECLISILYHITTKGKPFSLFVGLP